MYSYFIGFDISKHTLDVALVKEGQQVFYEQIQNSPQAIKTLMQKLSKQSGFVLKQSLVCMEHTGIYTSYLLEYLTTQQASIWLENALQIKQSSGMQRGKNDKVDAQRIACGNPLERSSNS